MINKIATKIAVMLAMTMIASVVLIGCDEPVTQVGGGGSSGGLPNPGPRWTSSPKGEHCVKITSGDSGDLIENICSERISVVFCAVNAEVASQTPNIFFRHSCGEFPGRLNPYYGDAWVFQVLGRESTPVPFEYRYAACIGRITDSDFTVSSVVDEDEMGLTSNSQGDYACYVPK